MSTKYVYDFGALPPKLESIEGVVFRDLVDPEVRELALAEYSQQMEPDPILGALALAGYSPEVGDSYAVLFKEAVHHQWSFVAYCGHEPVAFCLVRKRVLNAPELSFVSGRNSRFQHAVAIQSLAMMWRASCARAISPKRNGVALLEELGFDEIEADTDEAYMTTAEALINQGRTQEAKSFILDNRPHLAEPLRVRMSPNRLWWFDLSQFESSPKHLGQVLDSAEIRASSQLIYECFGDSNWVGPFSAKAIEGASFGVVVDGWTVAASLVGSQDLPSVWAICVSKDKRRKGLAEALLRQSMAALKSQGYPAVIAHVREANEASSQLFAKLGFQRIDSVTNLIELGQCAGRLRTSDTRYVPGMSSQEVAQICDEAGVEITA